MKQSFDTQLPSELESSSDLLGNFQATMSTAIRPEIEGLVSAATGASKYPFLADDYSVEEEATGAGVAFGVRNVHPLFGILEGGSVPHIIRAVNGPFLIFPFMGGFVKVAQVNHPGTQGEHALRDAWAGGLPEASEAGSRAFHSFVEGYGAGSGA